MTTLVPPRLAITAAVVLVVLGLGRAAHADEAMSSVALDIEPAGVDAELELPLAELDEARRSAAPMPGEAVPLEAYLLDHVHLAYSSDGRPWPSAVTRVSTARSGGGDVVVAQLHFARPETLRENALELTCDPILDHRVGHQIVVTVRRDFEEAKIGGGDRTLAGVLFARRTTLTLLRPEASPWRGMRAFFLLGAKRVGAGADQLAMLLLLLVTAPLAVMHGRWSGVRTARGARRSLLVVTGTFLVGSSVAFAAGALGLLRLPLLLVQALVALSVAAMALHALRPPGPFARGRREAWVAGLLGPLHGLGLAATFASLGVASGSFGLSFLSFDLGVLTTQLLVVALVAPSLLALRESRAYPSLRIGAAAVTGTAALAFLAELVAGLSSADNVAASRALATTAPLAALGWIAVAALALTAAASTLVQRARLRQVTRGRLRSGGRLFHSLSTR